MPGLPAMPSPTTAITAMPGRSVTLSIRLLESSSRNARRKLLTARGASDSASVNPIELSDDAWKIVETDSCSASMAPNVRAAMPCTPTIPLPATVTIACPRTIASALTGYLTIDRRAETSVPGASGSRNDRTCSTIRVPAIGMSARGWRTFAP